MRSKRRHRGGPPRFTQAAKPFRKESPSTAALVMLHVDGVPDELWEVLTGHLWHATSSTNARSILGSKKIKHDIPEAFYCWTCPCMTGHAVTLRLENLFAGETRAASGISGRCVDVTRCSGRTQWPGFATPFSRQVWASTKRNRASSS